MLTRQPFGFPDETSGRFLDVTYGIIAFCYHAAIGIPQPRGIQYDSDYSDSLFFCSDTCSWVW